MPLFIEDPNDYFLRVAKYEHCIYVIGLVGVISQILVALVIIGHLFSDPSFTDSKIEHYRVVYSVVAIQAQIGTIVSEIVLMRAVNQRILTFIQWWMFFSMLIFLISSLMAVIAGFTLKTNVLWVTLSFLYIVIRLPFQVHLVDRFAHIEILHKPANKNDLYTSVMYRRL